MQLMKQLLHVVGGISIAKLECLLAHIYSLKSGLHILTFENKSLDVLFYTFEKETLFLL